MSFWSLGAVRLRGLADQARRLGLGMLAGELETKADAIHWARVSVIARVASDLEDDAANAEAFARPGEGILREAAEAAREDLAHRQLVDALRWLGSDGYPMATVELPSMLAFADRIGSASLACERAEEIEGCGVLLDLEAVRAPPERRRRLENTALACDKLAAAHRVRGTPPAAHLVGRAIRVLATWELDHVAAEFAEDEAPETDRMPCGGRLPADTDPMISMERPTMVRDGEFVLLRGEVDAS